MSILKWNLKNIFLLPILVLILSLIGALQTSKLQVDMDLVGLLSDENPVVREMKHVSNLVGGGGYLIVLVGPTSKPESYLESIHKVVDKHPLVKYSYYEQETYLLRDKVLYILPKKEFKNLTKHARTLLGKDSASAGDDIFGFGSEDQEEEKKIARNFFADLKKSATPSRYFLSKDKLYAMLLVKPSFSSTDLDKSEHLVQEIDQKLKTILPPHVTYSLSGRYVEKLQDKKQFESDIGKTSLIATIILGFLLFFGIGSFRAGIFILIGVFMAMGLTVGIAAITIGRINILTGFLLAILSGLGSEYGIHYTRRYFRERENGLSKKEAIEKAYLNMSRSLLSAALTSAAAFFILIFSDFKGFSELGLIAGVGIVCIYLTFLAIFPLMGQFLPEKTDRSIKARFAKLLYSFPFKTKHLIFYMLLIPVFYFGFQRSSFEFNFERMQNFSKKTQETIQLTDELYGKAITPSAILTRDKDQLIELEAWLRSEENRDTIDQVISYYTVVPDDMSSRQERIAKIKKDFDNLNAKKFQTETGLEYQEVKKWLDSKPYGEELVPLSLKENFGKDKNILLVFPKERQNNYYSINRYADTLNKARETFPGMEVGSDTLVFSSILKHIIEDGKIVIIIFIIGAFFVFWPDFKDLKIAGILVGQIIVGSLLLIALMGIFDIPFTILNVSVIPAVLAAGIDMGVHQIHDENEHPLTTTNPQQYLKRGPSLLAARRISGPVHLGMLASVAGFGSLLFSEAKMLQGVGWISILGQISMYLVCMIFFPTIKDFIFVSSKPKNKK